MDRIKLGLPIGSLNRVGRGDTFKVLTAAGWTIDGYEPGKESPSDLQITNDPQIQAFLCRPQSAPRDLNKGMLDVAIIGEDWVEDYSVNKNGRGIEKIGDLGYGAVRLIVGVDTKSNYKSLSDFFRRNIKREDPILIFTEYVNITRKWVMQNGVYREIFGDKVPLSEVRGREEGNNQLVQILNSDGLTENYIAKGGQLIVDNTSSGKTLRENGVRELEKIMDSKVGLYKGPSCYGSKNVKATEIYDFLKGAVVAQNFFNIIFNVPKTYTDETRAYLMEENLCANEPTINRQELFSTFNIIISKDDFPLTSTILRRDFKATALGKVKLDLYVK